MAFENIDTKRLMNALNQTKIDLNYSKIENINNEFKSNSIWVSKSKDNLTSSIDKLINERFKKLEAQIDNYIEVTKLIEKYKELEADIKKDISEHTQFAENMKNQVDNLKESADRLRNAVISTKDFSIKNVMELTRTELDNNLKTFTQAQADKKRVMAELLTKIETLMNK